MLNSLFIFVIALFLVIRGATLATKYAALLAEGFRLSKYTIGVVVIAAISILPETFIGINSALEGVPSFGLGVLFGSNIADLTLVFAIIILLAGRGIKIESKILKNQTTYPFLLLLPLVLGLDGHFSRLEGLALMIAGAAFYYMAFKNGVSGVTLPSDHRDRYKNFLVLLFSMVMLLAGAYFTVTSATSLAHYLGINSILIGMFIVGLGTTMPELFFSLKSVRRQDDSLAVGDIMGTVLADATIVVGILALISPFSFPQKIIYVSGMFMVVAAFVLLSLMRSGRILSKKEAPVLFAFWIFFVLMELVAL